MDRIILAGLSAPFHACELRTKSYERIWLDTQGQISYTSTHKKRLLITSPTHKKRLLIT